MTDSASVGLNIYTDYTLLKASCGRVICVLQLTMEVGMAGIPLKMLQRISMYGDYGLYAPVFGDGVCCTYSVSTAVRLGQPLL